MVRSHKNTCFKRWHLLATPPPPSPVRTCAPVYVCLGDPYATRKTTHTTHASTHSLGRGLWNRRRV